jgi:hypothetical protein
MPDDLITAVTEALETLTSTTGLDTEQLFGERVILDLSTLPSQAAFAAGVIEGAGVALGLTALELLDELNLPAPQDRNVVPR